MSDQPTPIPRPAPHLSQNPPPAEKAGCLESLLGIPIFLIICIGLICMIIGAGVVINKFDKTKVSLNKNDGSVRVEETHFWFFKEYKKFQFQGSKWVEVSETGETKELSQTEYLLTDNSAQ
ncbi:hypothetical protein [Ruficoccus sp. ZRK36]|uniref:hypothetical protein n=1 Tax=Ruficoccus sp. ZRK36 TaxID=2866311 RepID=UPI001C73B486|nr:hypothetical protein [Ruficoccus sp. ZRK36]QYY36520.1 hypothetical protein K0V07_03385 [Ruficoccus sp. ZRK36]